MDRKFHLLAFSICIAVVTGYTFASKANRNATPSISEFTREVSQWSGNSRAVFKGTVINPSSEAIYDVNVTVDWTEFGGAQHTDSIYLGCIPEGNFVDFEMTFECDYLLIIQSVSPMLKYTELPARLK